MLLGAWLYRIPLSERVITSVLHESGLREIRLDIERLDQQQLHIAYLKFSRANESGQLQVEAQGISLDYSPGRLAGGQVDGITIKKLVVHSKAFSGAQQAPSTVHDKVEIKKLILTLRQALQKYRVFNVLAVDQLSLQGESFNLFKNKTLAVKTANDTAGLVVELAISDPSSPAGEDSGRRLLVARLTGESLLLALKSPVVDDIATIELTIADTSISGTYHLKPRPLQHWLGVLYKMDGMVDASNIKGTLTIDAANDDYIVTRLSVDCERLALDSYRAKNVIGEFILKNPVINPLRQTDLLAGSHVTFEKFGDESFSLVGQDIAIAGRFSMLDEGWDYQGLLNSDQLVVHYGSQVIRLKDISMNSKVDPDRLMLEGKFLPATLPGKFAFDLENDFSKNTGYLRVSQLVPVSLDNPENKISQLITPWPYPFDLLAGKVSLSSHAKWSKDDVLRVRAKINIEDAGGVLAKDTVFSGLSFEHELEVLPGLKSIRGTRARVQQLDTGVSVSNMGAQLAVGVSGRGVQPQFMVKDLRGEILGGHVSSDEIIYDLNKSAHKFKIKANNIDLAEIVKTQQLDDIVVTGTVDGTIPVEINEQGVLIENGALINNIRMGTIQYRPAAGADQLKQNQLTGIVLDALRDFRYSRLAAAVNYTPEGLLGVNLQLQGTSPELDTDRPVHLNINTEQNLVSLLKSLRFGQGLSDSIDEKVRKQYEKSNSNK